MTVEVTAAAGTRRAAVSGEGDMNSAPGLRRALREAVDAGPGGVVVHLAAVSYMDSAGIAVLIEGLQWSRRKGLPFALAAVPRSVRVVLELARLDTVFTILPEGTGEAK